NPAELEPKSGSDASSRIEEVSEWLAKTFEAASKPVPGFEYTPRSVSHLHGLLIVSKAKDEVVRLVTRDFCQKASEYRSRGQYFDKLLLLILHQGHIILGHAFGDQYRATDTVINGAGKLKLVFGMFTRVAIKQLDRIIGQGQFAISVEDTLKIIICRKQHKKLYSLEMELAAVRNEVFVLKQLLETNGIYSERKPLVMICVLTTFGRQKNRDAIRNVWMGISATLKKLEDGRALLHDLLLRE
ncbi:hypothetical protein S245_064171, partial [Arachis hypogaea]